MTNASTRSCLVTGALGFLGRRVVAEFADHGYRVVGLDMCTQVDPAAGLSDYRQAALPSDELADLLRSERPDVVVHAAGPASVGASIDDPAADFEGSVGVLFGVLGAVRSHSPEARFVTLSSAAVYGDPGTLPIGEDAPMAPVSPYGFHKAQCESLIAEFHKVYGIRGSSVRIFSAYGEGLRRQLLWDVCAKAEQGSVRLFGTGEESRDFIHADDVALAVRLVAERAPMAAEVYNVASGTETTVRRIAEGLVSFLAPGTPVSFSGTARPGDPLRWRADISRMQALGFEPRVALSDGLEAYCRWYASERERT